MNKSLDARRIAIYLLFAFGIAWATALVIWRTGGLTDSPLLLTAPFPLSLATALMATTYMFAPALAVVLTRLVTREGWGNAWLRPRLRMGWPYWLAGWIGPGILTILGGALFFAIFPRFFDPQLGALQEILDAQTAQLGQEVALPISLPMLVVAQTAQAMLIAPLLNSLFTFGEEWGWRGYLQPKLMTGLGWRRTMLLMGVIWGVWHWPLIFMGYEYGFDYPGAPWLGPLVFLWFTFVVGTFLGWLALKGKSVWPAVIGHAAINGIAALPALFVQGEPNPLLGPLPIGLIGSAGFAVVALWLFFRQDQHS
ncbi:MAG: CPBP family intramembrane metalloprotease [Caldilineaceae bacterium]|nr:CPBP family intramembrane metalloprotease [Caldilineaceae bacterium]